MMKKCSYFTLYIVLVFMCILSSSVRARADDDVMGVATTEQKTYNVDNAKGYKYIYVERLGKYKNRDINVETTDKDGNKAGTLKVFSTDTDKLRVYVAQYNSLNYVDKQTAMKNLRDSGIWDRLTENEKSDFKKMIYDISEDETAGETLDALFGDIKPDLYAGFVKYQAWKSPLGTLLGFLCIVICGVVVVSIALDITYVAVDPVRGIFENKNIPLVSKQTKKIVEKYSDQQTWVLLLNLLKHKSLMILALAVTISYLVDGGIFTIVGKVLTYFKGF